MLASTLIGTAAALAIQRARFPGRRALDALTYVPLVMPEIVMGLSLLIWFVALGLRLGTFSVILAHITFSLSYVVITVKSRLADFDLSLEEAARDLGATGWQVFRRVTLPLIWPGILSGALIAFTLSFDDFVVTFFTAGGGLRYAASADLRRDDQIWDLARDPRDLVSHDGGDAGPGAAVFSGPRGNDARLFLGAAPRGHSAGRESALGVLNGWIRRRRDGPGSARAVIRDTRGGPAKRLCLGGEVSHRLGGPLDEGDTGHSGRR